MAAASDPPPPEPTDWAARLVQRLLGSPFPLLLMLLAVVGGAAALMLTPREEEPQIVVPVADVVIQAPGLPAAQVERQVATPLEKLLSGIDGVEHVYSVSHTGQAVVTVRFYVGEDREDSLVKIYNEVNSHSDQVPAAVTSWVVRPLSVNDVPIVLAVLWSDDPERVSDHDLRRLAEEVEQRLKAVEDTRRTAVTGGRPRQVRVEVDPEALAGRRTAPLDLAQAIELSNRQQPAGVIKRMDRVLPLEGGAFIGEAGALESLVVNVVDGVPVRLGDVARVLDGPAEPETYSWIGFGPADPAGQAPGPYPAVTVSVAKQQGTNAVEVSAAVQDLLAELERDLFPPGVHYRVIRDYGETADAKVNDLVTSLLVAMLTVTVFLAVFINWRAALVVGLAVPVCYGITLVLDLLTGYTINRVSLFALILALGLLVDDPITGVDNIERYLRRDARHPRAATAAAMAEIRSPLVMSTLAIVAAFLPMLFITGMMGPYMAPMAFNVPVAVITSTAVAFLITPWLAYHLLPKGAAGQARAAASPTASYRLYQALLRPLLASRARAWLFLGVVGLLFAVAIALPALRLVPLKLLPYDNKNEFQIVIDMPEGTTVERTAAVARDFTRYLGGVAEVRDFTAFVGTTSPMDFNGMIRRHYLRDAPHQADIRVTLAPRTRRAQQSHALVLRLRDDLTAIARRHGATAQLVEVPPGPPVVATVTAEVYGSLTSPYEQLRDSALTLARRLEAEPGVVDVDTSVEARQQKLRFVPDKEKAALSGVSTEDISRTLALAVGGLTAGHLQLPTEAQPLPIVLRLPIERRSDPLELGSLHLKGRAGIVQEQVRGGIREAPQPLVPLAELGSFETLAVDRAIHHKNLRRVAYVYAEVAGRAPAEIVADVVADQQPAGAARVADSGGRPAHERSYLDPGAGVAWRLPAAADVVWTGEGEWDITVRVFRDLGIAFGVAVLGIFMILYVQTGLAGIAGIILLAIPLTMIGIMPGFWLLNQWGERSVAGYPDPVLFTATAMIGMIALAGIVVRSALILIEFIRQTQAQGTELKEALVQAGAVRMRPVLLTAGTTILGNLVITLDPIFAGLAWAIIFGMVASTAFTLAVVPAAYFLAYGPRPGRATAENAP